MFVTISKTIAKSGWQVATVRFIWVHGPHKGISSSGGPLEMVRSVRSAPVQSFAPLHNVSHVTQTKERKFHVKIRSSIDACVTMKPTYSRMHACEKASSYAVKSVTKSRGPIAISLKSPRLFLSLSFLFRSPRDRSLICNELAPPVIILRDHVMIIYTRIYRWFFSSNSTKNHRFSEQSEKFTQFLSDSKETNNLTRKCCALNYTDKSKRNCGNCVCVYMIIWETAYVCIYV